MGPPLRPSRTALRSVWEKACGDFPNSSTWRAKATRARTNGNPNRKYSRKKEQSHYETWFSNRKTHLVGKSLAPSQRLASSDSSHGRLSHSSFASTGNPGNPGYSHAARHIQVLKSGYGATDIFWAALAAVVLGTGYFYVTDTRSSIHRYISAPLTRLLYRDAEDSHHAGVKILKLMYRLGLHPRERPPAPDSENAAVNAADLRTEILDYTLANPVGISAGLDKHGEIPSALLELGPGIVEIGGVTPNPQVGNARPRVWRIPSQEALVNRYGLNSVGADAVVRELRMRVRHFAKANGLMEHLVLSGEADVPPGSLEKGKLLAVQIAKQSRTSPQGLDAVVRDYEICARKLAPYADVLVLNVSSPNTPGLRSLQQEEALTRIIKGVVDAAEEAVADITGADGLASGMKIGGRKDFRRERPAALRQRPAVMVKVSPDEDSDAQIAAVCTSVYNANAQGVIVANTTTSRPAYPAIPSPKQLPPKGFSTTSTASLLFSSPEAPSATDQSSSPSLSSATPLDNSHTDTNANNSILSPRISPSEAIAITQKGGYSGPLTFPRTLSLVQRYRNTLDSMADTSSTTTTTTTTTNTTNTTTLTTNSPSSSPSSSPSTSPSTNPTLATKSAPTAGPSPSANPTSPTVSSTRSNDSRNRNTNRKIIFASGGITTGEQAQQVLDAGADVAMLYTAMVYGGLGTVTRVKREMEAVRRGRG